MTHTGVLAYMLGSYGYVCYCSTPYFFLPPSSAALFSARPAVKHGGARWRYALASLSKTPGTFTQATKTKQILIYSDYKPASRFCQI